MDRHFDFFKAFVLLFAGVVINALLYFVLHTFQMDTSMMHIIESIMVIVSAFLVLRLFEICVFFPLETSRGKPLPRWLKHLVILTLAFIAVTTIVVYIYAQPFLSVATFSGLVGAGFAISVQGIVVDFFSGLTQDVERHFDEGDWLKFEEKSYLQVKKIGWRSTTFLSLFNTTITIPNSRLNERIENLSRPGPFFFDYFEITLDHDIPLERACRILKDGVYSMTTHRPEQAYVTANKLEEGGISYLVVYTVKDPLEIIFIKSDVMTAVVNQLHRYGIGVSEALGTYSLERAQNNLELHPTTPPELVVDHMPLFEGLNATQKKEVFKSLTSVTFQAGTNLMENDRPDDHILLIAEGSVSLRAKLKTGTKNTNDDASKLIRYFGLGAVLGSFYFIKSSLAVLDLRAETSVVCYRLPRALFSKLIKANAILSERLESIILDDHTQVHAALNHALDANKARESIKARLKELFTEIIA
ncbi:MAG: mechanosensitive ion channel domain-containing protein [Candidatus Nucleicultricaceae bacterium]